MHRAPVTTLVATGYDNRKKAMAAARTEVQRLFGSSYDPKENTDYIITQNPGQSNIDVRLIGDAYHALHDQPVTFVLVQKKGDLLGYAMERDSFIKEDYQNDPETKGKLRQITIKGRPSQLGALNSVCKPGFYWVTEEEYFNKENVDTTE